MKPELLAAIITASARLSPPLDLNVRTDNGDTPLHLQQGFDGEACRILVEAKADIHRPNNMGRTPLMAAVQLGRTHVVRVLLEAGVDIKQSNRFEETALTISAHTQRVP